MPLYEYSCARCEVSFEALVSASASNSSTHQCPNCGKRAHRILSSVHFSSGARQAGPATAPRGAQPDVTNLRLPPAARLCWMDDKSASRLAAYKLGRGAEYDDTIASRAEVAKQEGSASHKPAGNSHSHSPLSDPQVFANRRKAAQKAKVVESSKLTTQRMPE